MFPLTWHNISLCSLLLVNAVTFVIYGIDKWKARRSKWRISESTLLLLALVGGSVGAYFGIIVWHHKTLHKKFRYGVPVILLLQIALTVFLSIKFHANCLHTS